MTITQNDIKLVKSQVMDDFADGGGAPTANVVPDGASNAIFPDVSEFDRAGGRVKLRKLHVRVDTNNTDMYQGANVIIAEPPNDPRISVTLFSTGDTFDRRVAAANRIQAYLSVGVQYSGYLYGNHIAGQDTIRLFQKTGDLPPIGATLVLMKREGYGDQFEQYVRVIEAGAQLQSFEDDKGTYTRYILTLKLSSTLSQDFPGFDMSRYEYTKVQIAALTKISNTVVANAAKYYGVSDTTVAAALGDFAVQVRSMFTQLVPSAQVETPIADARTNQLTNAVTPTKGGQIVQTINTTWTTAQSMFVGGAIAPNTLSIVNGGLTVTDQGGLLMSGGSQVGTVDYENGVLALLTNVFGTSGLAFTVSYNPAAVPQGVNQSQGFAITAENRASSYVRTIEPAPVPGTLVISYMSQGAWYVLRDDGAGALRGADVAYGSGQLNLVTGTVVMTFGALPDVGSSVIMQWVEPAAARESDALTLDNNGKLYWLFNTDGNSVATPGAKAIAPNGLSIAWNDGTPRVVTDNGTGGLTGYGSGTVDYARGIIRLSPTTLPPKGTAMNVTLSTSATVTGSASVTGGAGNLGATNVKPGSVQIGVTAQRKVTYGSDTSNLGTGDTFLVVDDSAGNLKIKVADFLVTCGTVNYTTGDFNLLSGVTLNSAQGLAATAWDNLYKLVAGPFAVNNATS